MISNSIDMFLEEVNNLEMLDQFEKKYQFMLPENYKALVKKYDGIYLTKSLFKYTINFREEEDCIGDFLCWTSDKGENIHSTIESPPEFFPEKLVPFASNGGGDYICFDYRNCRENPPVVIWKHERNPGEDVFFIAHTFDDFIESLQKDEEVEW